MSLVLLISVFVFAAVASLTGAIVITVTSRMANTSEKRLRVLAGKDEVADATNLLKKEAFFDSLGALSQYLGRIASRYGDLNLLFEQANSPICAEAFLGVSVGLGVLGVAVAAAARAPAPICPVAALVFGTLPFIWILLRRRARFRKFSLQLPDALQLLGRALRSGHSLSSGIQFIVREMRDPIATEFASVWEKQNMGLPIGQALSDMLRRMPDPDLKFFVALVNMQRQTGGNLAELIEQIAHIVLERFKILGQVKALTGEGRISGIVLMILPVALFFTIYYLNPGYVMVLFNHELGRKMLLIAIVLQLLGAFTIKKIVNIKV